MATKAGKKIDVNTYMTDLQHERKDDVEALRAIVRGADEKLVERIKWNAPSYGYDDDRITFRLQPKGVVQLIFHRGAKKRTDAFEFQDETGLLEWLADDRAVAQFESAADIRAKAARLKTLIVQWMEATCQADRRSAFER